MTPIQFNAIAEHLLAALGQLPFPECRAIASARLPRRHSVDQDRCTGCDDDIDVRLRGMGQVGARFVLFVYTHRSLTIGNYVIEVDEVEKRWEHQPALWCGGAAEQRHRPTITAPIK